MSTTAEDTAALEHALRNKDELRTQRSLRALVTGHPRWRQVVSRLAVVVDPANPSFNIVDTTSALALLASAAKSLSEDSTITREDLSWLTSLALMTWAVGVRLDKLRSSLKQTSVLRSGLAIPTSQLGILIEHQTYMGIREAKVGSAFPGHSDPLAILRTTQQLPGGGNTNIVSNVEATVEAAELVLRFIHHRCASELKKKPSLPIAVRSPFEDEELAGVLMRAAAWRVLAQCYADVRFGNWHLRPIAGGFCLEPERPADEVRRFVGSLREQILLSQFLNDELLLPHSDTSDRVEGLARSLRLPAKAGAVWNGQFDRRTLAAASADMRVKRIASDYARLRHYDTFAASLVLPEGLVWQEWLHARALLSLLADAFQVSMGDIVDPETIDWERRVVVVNRRAMVDFLRADGVLTEAKADAAYALLTFSASRRSLELWDQPLLPLSPDHSLVVPSLIGAGSLVRALENCTRQWPLKNTGVRGTPFEKRIEADISQWPGIAQRGIAFSTAADGDVEFDLVWLWDDHLFLIETKCVRSVHSASEALHAREEIEYALQQLERRERIVRSDWGRFRDAANSLGLPELAPVDMVVVSVALTNVFAMTAWVNDGRIVTDDVCFRRYFGTAEMSLFSQASDGRRELVRRLGSVRGSSISPSEFVEYLRHPPQVERVQQHVTYAHTELAQVSESDPRILTRIHQFTGSLEEPS